MELIFGDSAISVRLLPIVIAKLTISGGLSRWQKREISELNPQIKSPFKIWQLDVLSRHQIFGIKRLLRSVTYRASEKLPDRNLDEFRSKPASSMTDLIERGGA